MVSTVVCAILLLYASWRRFWANRRQPAAGPRLPIYQASARPGLPPDAPDAPPTPLSIPGAPPGLSSALKLAPNKLKVLLRIHDYCMRFGVCTASNDTLARDWHDDGRPCTARHIRRLLLALAREGRLEGWFEKRHCSSDNPVGRALRPCEPDGPRRQMELRLGQQRRATPEELAEGHPREAPPRDRRRQGDFSTSERPPGGQADAPAMSAGHVRPRSDEMSTDPRSGSSTPRERYSNRTGPVAQATPAQEDVASSNAATTPTAVSAIRGAAGAGATASARTERSREYYAEMRRRREAGLCRLFSELHAGAETCTRCKDLGAYAERVRVNSSSDERVPVGWLFPTKEALADALRSHVPLRPEPPPEEDDVEEALPPSTGGLFRIVEVNGRPAYFQPDADQWVTLHDGEDGVARVVSLGLAVDDRPPKNKAGPLSTCVKRPGSMVPATRPTRHDHLREIGEYVADEIESLVDIVRPALDLLEAGPGLCADPGALRDLDTFVAEIRPLVAAAEAMERPIILDADEVGGGPGAGP